MEEGAWGEDAFLIHRQDREPSAVAGLWERWHGEDAAAIESCTIIVTDANALVRTIHDRMPVILGREGYGAWLDPGTQDADGLLAMVKPTPPAHCALHPVSRQVNSPRNDGPELLDAADSVP